ncbi:hypothetical protein J0H58_17070 [bacterium]|nr:hypothetical protein [bacterium]
MMMARVGGMADDVFTSTWNAAGSFDEVIERVREKVGKAPGGPSWRGCPRCGGASS